MLTESERLRRQLGKLMDLQERTQRQHERNLAAIVKLAKRLDGERRLLRRLPARIERSKKKLTAELRQERKADARSAADSTDPVHHAQEGETWQSHNMAGPT